MCPRTNKDKPLITTTNIFGQQVHCLLKDGEYYVLVEELHKLFFSHIPLSLFIYIVNQLIHSTFDLPAEDSTLFAQVFRRLKYNKIVPLTQSRTLLVKTKAILKKLKRRKQDLRHREDNVCEDEPVKLSQSTILPVNIVNVVLPNSYVVPMVSGIVFDVVPSDNQLTLISGRHHNVIMSLNPITYHRVIEKVNFTQQSTNRDSAQTFHIDANDKVIVKEVERIVPSCHVTPSIITECKLDQHKHLSKLTSSGRVTRDQSLSERDTAVTGRTVSRPAVTRPAVSDPNICSPAVSDSALTEVEVLKREQKKRRLLDIVDKIMKKKRTI